MIVSLNGRFHPSLLSVLTLLALSFKATAAITLTHLQCESRYNPAGLDVPQPRLSWVIESDRRAERQTACQIVVASTPEKLLAGQGDLWDSGKVLSEASAQVAYAGPAVPSRTPCYWRVRIWDRDGQPSAWSPTATWSTGLLKSSDWTAAWISDPLLADPANRPLTPIHCYRSELASRPDAPKWIVLDLGTTRRMDAVDLQPARPPGQNSDFRTVMFPLRFKVETADHPDFSDARLAVDQTAADVTSPRHNDCRFAFPAVTARYVRLTVTRLALWDGQDFGVALGGLAVFDGPQSIATGAAVACSDSLETESWSKRYLVAGHLDVAIAGQAPALATAMPDASANFTVSRVALLRREFVLPGPIRHATLYGSARGFYELHLNGQRVGDELLAPGYTDYGVRLQYQSHDVTTLLRPGTNALGALLGYGWYAGHMNLFEMRCIYGYFPQFLAQLDVELADGTHLSLGTDGQWRSTLDGPVRWSDLLDGEAYDCRRELPGWDQPGFDDHAWQPAWSQPRDNVPLVWQRSQPVRPICELRPVAVKTVKPGVYVFDLGQEITGWCRLKVDGPAGTHVRVRHAELISPDGSLNVDNLWGTLQQEDYILDGRGPRTLEPHFTYHGFRYVELTGLPGALLPNTLVAVNLRTDAPVIGQFECSNDRYNRIERAAAQTQDNLLFDVPAGCAARAERLAWTGDIRPCVSSLLFNVDAVALLTKYTGDLRDDQHADGRYTDITPQAHLHGTDTCVGSPGWADAGVSLPWDVYVNTGDLRLLADHFASARRWVDVIHASNPDLLWRNNRGMDWGDWLSAGPATPKEIGATAFFAHSADLVSRMATVLGRPAEAAHYQALFQGIRHAFVQAYVSPAAIIGGTPAGPPVMRDVTEILRDLVKSNRLTLAVQNDRLGGDPALNKKKILHLSWFTGSETRQDQFAEGSTLDLSGQPIKIVAASYGYDATDGGDTQGSYALALQFGLLDEPLRSRAARRLAQLVWQNGHHPTTGFWSSVELLLALSDQGYHPDAAEMLNQPDAPSWGYMADHGTTFWEAFDADKKNLSLNHWTHSAINEWLWRNVAGLNPDEQHPGYQAFTIHPRPTREVTWCSASYQSLHGRIASRWQSAGPQFTLWVTIPANTTATVYVPARAAGRVTEGGHPAAQADGVKFLRQEGDATVFAVASGTYHFRVN